MTARTKFIKIMLALCLAAVLCLTAAACRGQDTDSVIILYENDVHCAAQGYPRLAGLKQELLESYAHVGVVSAGDFVQGGTLGSLSRGGHIVELMNLVGYDAVTLGNHEFDYGLSRLEALGDLLDAEVVCCNFTRTGSGEACWEPYTLVTYGDTVIAYVGILTPETATTTNPAQFQDGQGNYLYTFHAADLYAVVQAAVDQAREAGADYVIALSHLGYDASAGGGAVVDLIQNTQGIHVVLDGHSHSVIENMQVPNRQGEAVLLSSTGTEFAYVGKLTLKDGRFTAELLDTDSLETRDEVVDRRLTAIQAQYAGTANRIIGESRVTLATHDGAGNRLVRNSETNLGNFCADALRHTTGADVSYINGGSLRSELPEGTLIYDHIYSVLPFGTRVLTAKVTGQVLLDMLEMSMLHYPEEAITFPHTSGIRFSVNTAIASSVETDENGNFIRVAGPYRVYGVQVLNKTTGEYEALDPEAEYVLATIDYFLVSYGGGLTMLRQARDIQNTEMLDVECLETYISGHLDSVIGEDYAALDPRITFVP